MRHFLFILILSTIVFSCTSKDKIPREILSLSQMKIVMWDLMKVQELAANDSVKGKNNFFKDSVTTLFSKVFFLHHTDRNIFYSSYQYYLKNPDDMSALMDSISALANRERYSQYMHSQVSPGNQNAQYNHSSIQHILKPGLKNSNFLRRDSLFKKNIKP